MTHIIKIGYYTTLLVQTDNLPDWVNLLTSARIVEGGTVKTSKPIDFSIEQPDPEMDKVVSPRELALQAEAEQRTKWWTDSQAELNKVKVELAALKGEGNGD